MKKHKYYLINNEFYRGTEKQRDFCVGLGLKEITETTPEKICEICHTRNNNPVYMPKVCNADGSCIKIHFLCHIISNHLNYKELRKQGVPADRIKHLRIY